MANKTTKALRELVRKAGHAGQSSVEHQTPVGNWHDLDKPEFRTVRVPTAQLHAGMVSCNRKRNSAMRVYQNRGGNQRTLSLTCHEPLVKGEPMRFPNHSYLEYRRAGGGTESAAKV